MMFEVFKTFFLLGWVSFGGPAAHLGYFRNSFVEKHKWLSDDDYAQIVALSQFLPGPGSSQVGFAIGYKRAGLPGAISAFVGFTLPSVLLMVALGLLSNQLLESTTFNSVIHGLKLLAVVVVADATWGMFSKFCQQRLTVALCIATAVFLLIFPSVMTQMVILVVSAVIGMFMLCENQPQGHSLSLSQFSLFPLVLFIGLLLGLPLISSLSSGIELFSDFYRAGSLVFGGGHVVLPLLQNIVGEQLTQDAFLTGYAAAQAVPGPMFTLATYLGYMLMPSTPILGAILATIAVFLPGFLLLLGVLKNWQYLANISSISAAITGVNAAVVGLLLSALYTPVLTSSVFSAEDFAIVLVGAFLLKQLKLPIVALVAYFSIAGLLS